ncbi:hypothetical protein V8F06_014388 [Rhypophila decipiens]
MASRNEYVNYKRGTNRLIYWVIRTSNSIITKLNRSADAASLANDVPRTINTTGTVTAAGLVALSSLIGKHMDNVPASILGLFESVIDARYAFHAVFEQLAAMQPDPDLTKSNASHKSFINTLEAAWKALGGKRQTAASPAARDNGVGSIEKDDIDRLLLANKFEWLELEKDGDSDAVSDEEAAGQASTSAQAPKQKRQARPRRGKKGKGKKGKKQQPKASAASEKDLDEIPLESYRIIESGEGGLMTDYLMAVYVLLQEMMALRFKMQETWREVAYDGLNSAVAGALSKVAVASVQRTALSIFVDFPGNDSFETVFNTITRGDVEKAQGMFSASMINIHPDDGTTQVKAEKVSEAAIDVKEHFLFYAHRDLVDFVTDFQQTRSGKPTKRMLDQIKNWDPDFDLQRATAEERIKWRRVYTINWLYDLVNVFSGVVVQRKLQKGENHFLERVDWSINGPWDKHRVLYGLNEFAGFVTSLAMQKPNTPNIKSRILPQHVFQLQLIVDSMTATRGWTVGLFRGHIINPPPRNPPFRARRDVDLFLDRDNKNAGHGFLQGCDILQQVLRQDGKHYGRSHQDQHEVICAHLDGYQFDMTNWLGESKYMHGLNGIPPSRFSNTNANGLWEYSPMLCATGLEEALEHAYLVGMYVWDCLPQILLLVHLHNMLARKGYIHPPLGLYQTIEDLFREQFFKDGQVPSSNFAEALMHVAGDAGGDATRLRRRRQQMESFSPEQMAQPGSHVHRILAVERNVIFKQNSILTLFRHADWNMDLIPEEKIPLVAALAGLRLSQVKPVVDPATGKKTLPDTSLVRRARKRGMDDKTITQMCAALHTLGGGKTAGFAEMMGSGVREAVSALFPPDYADFETPPPLDSSARSSSNNQTGQGLDSAELLGVLKVDFLRDICGNFPLSSFNYVWCAARLLITFAGIEQSLREMRNETYMHIYENPATMPGLATLQQKRFGLVFETLQKVDGLSGAGGPRDEECLDVIAKALQNPSRPGFLNHCYWDDVVDGHELKVTEKRRRRETDARRGGPDEASCCIM